MALCLMLSDSTLSGVFETECDELAKSVDVHVHSPGDLSDGERAENLRAYVKSCPDGLLNTNPALEPVLVDALWRIYLDEEVYCDLPLDRLPGSEVLNRWLPERLLDTIMVYDARERNRLKAASFPLRLCIYSECSCIMSIELPPSMYILLTLYEVIIVVMTNGPNDGMKVSHGILHDGTCDQFSITPLSLYYLSAMTKSCEHFLLVGDWNESLTHFLPISSFAGVAGGNDPERVGGSMSFHFVPQLSRKHSLDYAYLMSSKKKSTFALAHDGL
nr:hypothetical protein [Tanacetum cinerariifolium]